MLKHLFALLFFTFALVRGNEIEASPEVSLDEPQPQDSFLSLNAEASTFSLDLFNVTELFNASAIVNSVQEMMDPIGQRIDSVGQQIDAAFAWIGDGIQDTVQEVVKSIHDPINEQLDAVWSLIGGEPVNLENEKMAVVNEEGKIVSVVPKTNSDENIEVTIATEKEIQDNNGEEIQVTMFQEEVMDTPTPPTPVPVPVPEPVRIETPVSVPIADIDEIVVLVDYNDIAAAMNSPNTTAESIEKEPFFVRFFEVFMGKEVELEVKSANLTPVEESKKKRQIISYDAL